MKLQDAACGCVLHLHAPVAATQIALFWMPQPVVGSCTAADCINGADLPSTLQPSRTCTQRLTMSPSHCKLHSVWFAGCLVAAAAAASYFTPRAIIACGCTAAAVTWLALGLALPTVTAGAGASAAAVASVLSVFAVNVAAGGGLVTMFPVVATENQVRGLQGFRGACGLSMFCCCCCCSYTAASPHCSSAITVSHS